MLKKVVRTWIEWVLRRHGYRLAPANFFDWPLRDSEFMEIFRKQQDFGWQETSGPKIQRMYMIRNLVLSIGGLHGHWAECGIFKGATSLVLAEYAKRYNLLSPDCAIHLFDSFEGLSDPAAKDCGTKMQRGDYRGGEDEVRANLAGYDQLVFHRGWIPDRFVDVANDRFAFVHIDVDLYEPVRECLAFFLPRMIDGGVVVLDDYGCTDTPGALIATNETAAEYGYHVAPLPYGQAFIPVRRVDRV